MKIDASQMCWMHLLPLGECTCDVVNIPDNEILTQPMLEGI